MKFASFKTIVGCLAMTNIEVDEGTIYIRTKTAMLIVSIVLDTSTPSNGGKWKLNKWT